MKRGKSCHKGRHKYAYYPKKGLVEPRVIYAILSYSLWHMNLVVNLKAGDARSETSPVPSKSLPQGRACWAPFPGQD